MTDSQLPIFDSSGAKIPLIYKLWKMKLISSKQAKAISATEFWAKQIA